MTTLKLAVFLGEDAFESFHNEESNLTEVRVHEIFREKFADEIESFRHNHEKNEDVSSAFDSEVTGYDDVYVRVLTTESAQEHGNALAGYLGFVNEQLSDDTWHGVIEV